VHPIRLLRPADIPSCMALKEEAGWNQTEQDWLKLFEFAPDSCFGIEIDGTLASTITAVCYGTELAWIGMVLTGARFRRRGLASALLEHTLHYLARIPMDWIKLDATEMGRPVYQRFGFEDECAIERWLRPGTPATFFEEQSRELGDSFARGRPGSKAAYFGPCRATSREAARDLLEWFLELHRGEAICWDILPANVDAVDLARAHGFTPLRKLVRMALRGRPGAAPRPTDIAHTYATAGFEWG
jgi:GNAT superfamily N-acetyltransferase